MCIPFFARRVRRSKSSSCVVCVWALVCSCERMHTMGDRTARFVNLKPGLCSTHRPEIGNLWRNQMRIGNWTVRLVRWAVVIEPAWGKNVGDITSDGRHEWVNAAPYVDINKYRCYSAEDIT